MYLSLPKRSRIKKSGRAITLECVILNSNQADFSNRSDTQTAALTCATTITFPIATDLLAAMFRVGCKVFNAAGAQMHNNTDPHNAVIPFIHNDRAE